MPDIFGFVWDVEADDLYPAVDKVWYVNFTDLHNPEKTLKVFPFKEDCLSVIKDFVHSYPDGCFVVGHNILQYDVWVIWKLLGVKPLVYKAGKDIWFDKEVQFIDTRYMSMLS